MRKFISRYKIIFFLLFLSAILFGQDQNYPKTIKDIETHKGQDTAKVNLYIRVATGYLNNQNLDSAFLIAANGLFLAKKLEYNIAVGELYAIQGDIKVMQNELFQALDHYLSSVNFIGGNNGKRKLASVLLVIGNIYVAQANYPKALEYYQRGQAIADSLNVTSIMVHFYNNLGELYGNLGQFEESIESYNHALDIYTNNNNSDGQASIHTNLSNVYIKMGDTKQARENVERAFHIYENSSNNEGLLNTYNSMAAIERKEGNYNKAISYYEKGLKHLGKIGIEYKGPKSIYEADLYSNIGFCNLKIKNYGQAEENLLKGYKIALKTGQLGTLQNITHFLSELYEIKGDLTKAFNYYREYNEYSDSLSQK